MSRAILDDHFLRDLLANDVPAALVDLLADYEPATTNLYLYRLSKSVASARGAALTGGWSAEHRLSLGSKLLTLPDDIEIVPLRTIAFRMAEISATRRLSTLGAECVAAAEHLDAPLCVWSGDDGPGIRVATSQLGVDYRKVTR